MNRLQNTICYLEKTRINNLSSSGDILSMCMELQGAVLKRWWNETCRNRMEPRREPNPVNQYQTDKKEERTYSTHRPNRDEEK